MKKHLIIVLVGLLIALGASAQHSRRLLQRSGNSDAYPGSNYLTVYDSTKVTVQESGLSYVNTHHLFKVLTPKGALDLKNVIYGYDPLSAYVEIQKVIVHRKDGSTVTYTEEDAMDYPATAYMIYWGAREKMIDLGRLYPGDGIEVYLFRKGFTYALLGDEVNEENYIPPMRGHYYDIVPFYSHQPVLNKVYQVDLPSTKKLQYKVFNNEQVVARKKEVGELIRYTFSKRNIEPFERESRMVALDDVAPKLLMSTADSWEAKSLWFYGVNEDYGSFESFPELDRKVSEILAGARNEVDSIAQLTHWVADNMRYSGISMGKGEGFTLHSAKMNLNDLCGVCKDKAGLLIAMLRSAGFEAYPAMTMAGSRIDDLPADQFNHCVTLVKTSNGKYKLLDPTWVPFTRELWSSAEQQQNYLPGIPGGADLQVTPISSPENHYLRIKAKSRMSKDGTLMGDLKLTAEGQSDGAFRRYFVNAYRSGWQKHVEEMLLKVVPQMKIDSVAFGNPYDYSDPFQLTVRYSIPQYALVTEKELVFHPITTLLFHRQMSHLSFPTKQEERKYSFRDRCSRLVEIEEHVVVEGAKGIAYAPVVESSNGTGADFEGAYSFAGTELQLKEKVVLKKRVYNPEDWTSFRAAVLSQKRFSKEPVILKMK